MTSIAAQEVDQATWRRAARAWFLPGLLTALAFALVFAKPMALLARDWWTDPEAGHGLLLAPASLWFAWRRGWLPERRGSVAGLLILIISVFARVMADLAAELFVMKFTTVLALLGLVVYYAGPRQARAWWLPFVLLSLAIPLPELLRSGLALPLQFKASAFGAALLEWRSVPVRLSGNIIELPGHRLFVTEACSGLRSLTALLSLAVLMGGLWLKRPGTRFLLVLLAVPIAVAINGLRVFLTGYLVYFVDPKFGEGFLHLSEGWLLFVVSFGLLAAAGLALTPVDRWWTGLSRRGDA